MRVLVRDKGDVWLHYSEVEEGIHELMLADSFFCPTLYDVPDGSLLPTHTIALDIGDADILYLPLEPATVVNTSPGRNQVYVVFDTPIDEYVSKQIATSVEGADLTSIPLNYLMRIPFTRNKKYHDEGYVVNVTHTSDSVHKVENLIPSPNGLHTYTVEDLEFSIPEDFKPIRFVEDLGLPPLVYGEFHEVSENPKRSLERLITECLRRNLPKGVVYAIAKASKNNYTVGFTYHADEELRKLILKLGVKAGVADPKEAIDRVRMQAVTMEQRENGVSNIVKNHMREIGKFSHLRDGGLWFVPPDRQPISISRRSEALFNHLNRVYGINSVSTEAIHTTAELTSFCDGLPQTGFGINLSYYDDSANRLLVSTGANQIYMITPDKIVQIPNGSYNTILFPMNNISLPFIPRKRDDNPTHWSETVFEPVLDHILTLTHDEARALLTAWLLFLFFKSHAAARPILAVLGQPGSGKSTLMKRIATLIYGKVSGFTKISNSDDFDQVMSSYPLLIIDNLDTWERWLPDALAQSAASIDRGTRKKYTDNDLFIIHRDALVAITAHDPKFSRADVADRLLILPMKRISEFVPEGQLLKLDRAGIWADIFDDLQKILQTPRPQAVEQLRVMDFSYLGSWITSALGMQDLFESAISKLHGHQKTFALDNEQLLMKAVTTYAIKSSTAENYKAPQQLFLELEMYSGDAGAFHKRYKSAQSLGSRLSSLQDALRTMVDIDLQTDQLNRKTWRIRAKD